MRKAKKRKQRHHDDGALKKTKKTYRHPISHKHSGVADDSDVVILDSSSEASVGDTRGHGNPKPFSMRDTRAQKSGKETYAVDLIGRFGLGIGYDKRYNTKSSGYPMKDPRSLLRVHLRNLMFPTAEMLITGYVPSIMTPWKRLGIWLYYNKKRFTNWNRSISFLKGRMGDFRWKELRKMLKVDLVDWSQEEIEFETVDIPLLLDPKGRVLVKVGDLPRMYPDHGWELEHTSVSSLAIRPRRKRKHRTCSSERDTIAATDSDGDSGSRGESVSASEYHSIVISNGEKDFESQGET
ncbi:hypothetical protein Clacol_008596 [Clathrus columnatus]|uniref:Uncharacterized protein n=1 Tax=Clathrus columnatus TaxID=1419009 RepID=A0AAV5AKQ4_9AGAM|nr:hypothetical protein Clacol_008596 [Clathrus columnatus]